MPGPGDRRPVRDDRGVAALDDMALLAVAVLAFSLFFASLAGAHVTREQAARGERLQGAADALLRAFVDDPRWTAGHGRILREGLVGLSATDLLGAASGRPFRLTVWDLATGERWAFGDGATGGDRRTATTAANLVSAFVDPARVTATVWGP